MKNDNFSIANLMIKSHQEIERSLKSFEREIGHNFNEIKKLYPGLKKMIEQHFLIEEQAIFSFLSRAENDYDGVNNLIHQHNLMLEMLDEIDNYISQNKWPNIAELKKLIMEHKNIEDGVLYPRLDTELDGERKNFIIEKIKDFSKIN